MSKVANKFFSYKGAYNFGKLSLEEWEAYARQELIRQLLDLERKWVTLSIQAQEQDIAPTNPAIEYIQFRLQELQEFISQTKAPKIVSYVCNEIYDFLEGNRILQSTMTTDEVQAIGVTFTVLSSSFQPELLSLNLLELEEVAKRLQEAVEPIIQK